MRKNQMGMTLLEVMFAIAVLTIVICGVACAYFNMVKQNMFDADQMHCQKLAHQTLETLISMDLNEIEKYDSENTDVFYGASMKNDYEGRNFTAVNNRVLSGGLEVFDGSQNANLNEDMVDRGLVLITEDDTEYGDEITEVNYEPQTSTMPCTTMVTVEAMPWSDISNCYKITVSIPEFGILISTMKTDADL